MFGHTSEPFSLSRDVNAVIIPAGEVLILREIPLRELPRIMRSSMVLVGGILIILGASVASPNGISFP